MSGQTRQRCVAIVEDEPALRQNYQIALEKAGFATRCFSTASSALGSLSTGLPDLALIDVGLGEDHEGGFELCRELRALSSTLPILFLTARDSELDVISGLRLGADDYLVKDITLAHLIARINALFRRTDALLSAGSTSAPLESGSLQLDSERLSATWDTQVVELTVTEFWLVHSLVQRPGQVKTRQQLMDAASVVLDDQTITAHIKRIRRKFTALAPDFDAIQTVYGMGYRWVEKRSAV
ncbi:MAG: proteobacterial dedicated sortase system response regulator [Granulosicoccus sp.]|nr:proteobacterial dedicated sortase system response regulator [Granulosicoccus sp.]